MTTPTTLADAVAAIRGLSLADIDRRLAEIDGERAALSRIRRSLIARDRARRRAESLRPRAAVEGRR